ncbi:DDHD domain-containing protein [Fennellomyces sp. T-0311]|nr:DDHD domain-containing protein [Fennellomyces sp. T-0311]
MYFETTGLNTPELAPSFYTAMEDPEELKSSTVPLIPNALFEDDSSYYANSDHVVFVIHGIGQQTEQYGMFNQHMQSLRETMQQVLQTRMPQEDVRIKMIPIEWHRHIHLETDPKVHRIQPKSIPTMRMIESDYLADVLYYFSKDRGQSIIDHVTQQFNSAYHDFMEQQPNFNGKVAILGYSLGGLITWDILSHQRENLTTQEMDQLGKFDITVPKLDFKPDFLFGMGCPVAGLLVARNQDPRLYHPDYNTVFENIYHPMDPLAFRLEPLLNETFDEPAVALERAIPPQPSSFASLVFSLFGGSKEEAGEQGGILSSLLGYFAPQSPPQQEEQHQQRRASEGDILRLKQPESIQPLIQRKRSQTMPSLILCDHDIVPTPSLSATPTSSCPTTAPQTPTTECVPAFFEEEDLKPALPHGRRYDYELKPESFMGMISNEYILGLRAHFSYWTNKDMLWHIFLRMEDQC